MLLQEFCLVHRITARALDSQFSRIVSRLISFKSKGRIKKGALPTSHQWMMNWLRIPPA